MKIVLQNCKTVHTYPDHNQINTNFSIFGVESDVYKRVKQHTHHGLEAVRLNLVL